MAITLYALRLIALAFSFALLTAPSALLSRSAFSLPSLSVTLPSAGAASGFAACLLSTSSSSPPWPNSLT